MKYLKILGLAAVAAMALTAFLAGPASGATLEKYTTPSANDVFGLNTHIEATLEAGNSAVLEDAFGFTATTCTTSTVTGKIEKVTPESNPRGKITTLDFGGCPEKHDVTVQANGELEVQGIAGTTNGTVISIGAKVSVFNTLLNQTCIANTGAGTDIGTLTGAKSSTAKATMDINGLIPLEGCSASNARWTGKYEVTSPLGLTIEPS